MEKNSTICNQKIPQYQQCHTNGEEQQDMSPEDTTIPAVSHKWRRAARYVTRRYHNTSSVTQMEKNSKICHQKIPQYQQCHTNGEEQQDVTRRYHNTSSVTQMEKSSKICNQKIPQYQQCHTNGEEQQDVTRRYHNTSSVTQMEKSSKICNQKIPQYQQCHTNGEEQQDM